MVTPAMQQQPQVIYGPNGEVARWNGREYIAESSQATPPTPSAIPGFTPMQTPADARAARGEQRQTDQDAWMRQRQIEADARAARAESRADRSEQRAQQTATMAARGGTPEMRGRLQFGLPIASRAENRLQDMEADGQTPLNRDWGAATLDAIPDWGLLNTAARIWGGEDYQAYDQATASIEAALLPVFSGMAVTEGEAKRFIRANLPRLGDSSATLAEKSKNRSEVLNAGALVLGRPMPFPEVGVYGVGDASASRAVLAAIPSAGAAGGPGDGPQPGDVRVTQQPLAPTDTPNSLSAQGYVYDPARDTWSRSSHVDLGHGDSGGGIEGPVRGDEQTPAETRQGAGEARTAQGEGIGRKIDAGVRGIADTLTFGFADEIAAGANTVLPLDRGSRSLWTDGAGDAFTHNLAMQRGIDQADARDVPVSRGTGQVAGGLMAGAGLVKAAQAAPQVGRFAASVGSRAPAWVRNAGIGAGYGAAYGLGSGEGNVMERADDAAIGGAIGAGAGVAAPIAANALGSFARGVGRPGVNALGDRAPQWLRNFVEPNAFAPGRQQQVRTLREHGVSMTPGQSMGGIVNSVEDLAQRAPILGPAIRGARQRSTESLNRAVGNRALDNIEEGIPASVSPGGEMVAHVRDRLGQAFDRAYSLVPRFIPDEQLAQNIGRIGQARSDLPPAMQQQFDAIIKERLARLGQSPTGQQVGAIRTELSGLAAGYLRAPDPAQQGLGRMLSAVSDELDDAVARLNPEAGKILSAAHAGYRDYIRMERASTAAGGQPFTPSQLASAVRQSDGTVRRGAVGRGEAQMQDLSRAAQEVLPGRFGNPGTADAIGLGGLGVGLITEPLTTTAIAGGLGAASVPYQMMGRKVLERLPDGARRALRNLPDDQLDDLMQASAGPEGQARATEILTPVLGSRREARNLARAIRYQLTIGPQSGRQE